MIRQTLGEVWSAAIEGPGWFELAAGATGALVGWALGRFGDVAVKDHVALYSYMVSASVGLMTVSAIVVTLSSAVSPRSIRLTQSVGTLATASFVASFVLLISTGVALFLLAFDASLVRGLRYGLAGAWVGLVAAASARSLALGRRILVATLRDHVVTLRDHTTPPGS